MPGNKAGGIKAAATNKARHGEDFYARIGARGGRNGHTGGFAANRELARIAGKKGGTKSRRTGVPNGKGKTAKKTKPVEQPEPVMELPNQPDQIRRMEKKPFLKRIFGR